MNSSLADGHCVNCGGSASDATPDGLCSRCILTSVLGCLTTESDPAPELESPSTLLAGREFAGYELISEIARGGMGVVFRARQKRPDRIVALKVIAAGELASPRMIERFHTESEAAARLEHPNIVPIYEVGQHGGWQFFSMRLIEGRTVTQAHAGKPLPMVEAAQCLAKVARAVHHAHQRGVLHRDLKPSNILLDAQGEPHLTDFGLAKVLTEDSGMTLSHAVLGTPAYMAPEQASGNTRDVTTAADVYGLGAVLYEMLTGRPPFSAANPPALLRKIVEEDPPPLNLPDSGSQDLAVICHRCLEKSPGRRYATAAAIADDLDRWLRHEPIHARASGAWERGFKWMRRHRTLSTLAGTIMAGVLVVTAISLGFNVSLSRARLRAEKGESESQLRLLGQHLRESARLAAGGDAFVGALALVPALDVARHDPEREAIIRQRLAATFALSPRLLRLWDAGGTPVGFQFSSDNKRLLAALRQGGNRVWDLSTQRLIKHPAASQPPARVSVLGPNGGSLMELFDAAPFAQVWNIDDGSVQPLALATNCANVAAFSPDGKVVATGGARIQMWDAATGRLLAVAISNDAPCNWLGFTPDGRWLLGREGLNRVWQWDARTGRPRDEVPISGLDGEITPRISADGKWLLAQADVMTERVELADGDHRIEVPGGDTLFDMNFNPNGNSFATAAFGEQARMWNMKTGLPMRLPVQHESGANKALFSPDGLLLVTAGFDYQLRLRRALDHRSVAPAVHHSSLIEAVAFSADGRFLAVGDVDGVVQVWDLEVSVEPFMIAGIGQRQMTVSADGQWTVVADPNSGLHVCATDTGLESGQTLTLPGSPAQVSLEKRNRFIAFAGHTVGARVWDFTTRKLLHEFTGQANPATADISGIEFSPDGHFVATMTPAGLVQRWRIADGEPLGPVMNHGAGAVYLSWSGDGRWIITGGGSAVRVWDAATGTAVGELRHGRDILQVAEPSPDGRLLLVGFGNEAIEPFSAQLYELPSLKPFGPPLRHGDGISTGGFSFDGRYVATGGEDNVARIWRVADGQPVSPALRTEGIVRTVAFSADGHSLATGGSDGFVRLWDVDRGELMAPPVQMGGRVVSVRFNATGNSLAVGGLNGQAWKISFPTKLPPAPPPEQMAEFATGQRVDASGGFSPIPAAELAREFAAAAATVDWPRDSQRWHLQHAAIAEQQTNWFPAIFHLEHALAARPDDAALRARLEHARQSLK